MAANLKLLQADEALAKRWLRTGHIPIAAWQWLGGRAHESSAVPLTAAQASTAQTPTALTKALAQFAKPLNHASNTAQSQSLTNTLDHTAHLCAWCFGHIHSSAGAAVSERMLAAAVLPLYRGLAAGAIDEITSVMKQQLADAMALTALEGEFGDDLRGLLIEGVQRNQSPYEVLQQKLEIDLSKLAETLMIASQQHSFNRAGNAPHNTSDSFNHAGNAPHNTTNSFNREGNAPHSATDSFNHAGNAPHSAASAEPANLRTSQRPDWGQPPVLWRLAGELIADRAEFMVPRAWISVPVPWNEASEHWRAVADALRKVESCHAVHHTNPITAAAASKPAASQSTANVAIASKSQPTSATTATDARVESASESASVTQSIEAVDDITRLKLEIEIADSVDALVQASRGATRIASDRSVRTDEANGLTGNRSREPDFIVPKVIIAEVRSHNDPAFVTIVRRQVALCRTEERTMSLVAVCVEPDGEEESMPTLESLGLACWQQQLVNWMADHPEIHDPYAFVSSEGELILCLMDIERNTTTGLLRQGLIEVLTGQSLGGDPASSLSRVSTPARYHSGIGSISSPAAGFEAEQLIEATYRCLSAAQRHGKASIKSIEVF